MAHVVGPLTFASIPGQLHPSSFLHPIWLCAMLFLGGENEGPGPPVSLTRNATMRKYPLLKLYQNMWSANIITIILLVLQDSTPCHPCTGFVLSCTYSPDGQYIASASEDKSVKVHLHHPILPRCPHPCPLSCHYPYSCHLSLYFPMLVPITILVTLVPTKLMHTAGIVCCVHPER